MKKIVIEALYGEYSNLYGDRGNLLYVQEKPICLTAPPLRIGRWICSTSDPARKASRSRSWNA